MRAGRLDRKIEVQRRTDAKDAHGQPIPTWSRIGATRWASYSPIGGEERYTSDQFIGRQQVEFRVRWASDLSDLNPKDRVVFPIMGTSEEPTDSQIYEIMAVHELGRREGLRIQTARRSEI